MAAKKSAQKSPRPKRHPVALAEIAFKELQLSSMTKADNERLWQLFRGLRWLDDDQTNLRCGIDDLLAAYDGDSDAKKLVTGLRKLVEILPEKAEIIREKMLAEGETPTDPRLLRP